MIAVAAAAADGDAHLTNDVGQECKSGGSWNAPKTKKKTRLISEQCLQSGENESW